MFSPLSSLLLLLLPFVVTRALFVEGWTSVEVLASFEVPGLGFFYAAMWSLRNEPRVGAKTIGVRYCYRHKLIGLINGPRVSWA